MTLHATGGLPGSSLVVSHPSRHHYVLPASPPHGRPLYLSLGRTGKTLIDLPFLLRRSAFLPRCVPATMLCWVLTRRTRVAKLTVQQSWPCNWTLQGHTSRLNVVLLAVTLCCPPPPPSHSAPSSPHGYLRAMTSGVVAA